MPKAEGITVTVDDRQIVAWLREFAARGSDAGLVRPLGAIGAEMESRIEQRFDSKTDPRGNPWKPHAQSTRDRYAAQDKGRAQGTLLQRTGQMRDSLSHQVQSTAVSIGFGVERAAYHEFGTDRMPRRGMLTADPATGELGEGDTRAILDILQRHFSF